MHELMHSHIDRIGVIFLQRVLSNVSSIFQLEKKHIHVGCICMLFLRCAFSARVTAIVQLFLRVEFQMSQIVCLRNAEEEVFIMLTNC